MTANTNDTNMCQTRHWTEDEALIVQKAAMAAALKQVPEMNDIDQQDDTVNLVKFVRAFIVAEEAVVTTHAKLCAADPTLDVKPGAINTAHIVATALAQSLDFFEYDGTDIPPHPYSNVGLSIMLFASAFEGLTQMRNMVGWVQTGSIYSIDKEDGKLLLRGLTTAHADQMTALNKA